MSLAFPDELDLLFLHGKWQAMRRLIDDEGLQTVAVVGTSEELGGQIQRRYGGGQLTRIGLLPAGTANPSVALHTVEAVQESLAV